MTRRQLLVLAGGGVVGAAAAVAAGGAAFVVTGQAKYDGRFYPGVRVDGEDLGGFTFAEALGRLQTRWDAFAANPMTLRLGEQTWQPSASEVGVSVEYLTPLRDAFAWGREGSWPDRLARQREVADQPRDWQTSVTFEPRAFTDYVDRIGASLRRPAAEGALRIDQSGGRQVFVIDKSAPGQQLAAADYVGEVTRAFAPPRRLVVDLAVKPVLPHTVSSGFNATVADAQRLLKGHIRLNSPLGLWSIRREDLAGDLRLEGPPDRPRVAMDLDYRAFADVARQAAGEVRVDPVEPKIRVNASGEVVPTVEGRPGRKLDVETLWARVRTAFESGAQDVSVPIVILKPDVSRMSASDLQFDNTIALGRSFFWGSASNRVHNINNGSSKVDGTVVAPGEQFSFNDVVGPITYENGFVEGLVIAPTRTEPGVGGGICQVSTTLFRALFWAGLPIDERWQHVYRVGYYELGPNNPPGFDAAIWQPSQDVRFTNDSPNYLLISRKFSNANGSLEFHVRGAPLAREVELDSWRGKLIEPPPMKVVASDELAPGEVKRTDTAVAGMQAVIYRTVSFSGRVLFKDQFPSAFHAWPERWEVGPEPDGSLNTSAVPGYTPEGEAGPPGEIPDVGATPDAAT